MDQNYTRQTYNVTPSSPLNTVIGTVLGINRGVTQNGTAWARVDIKVTTAWYVPEKGQEPAHWENREQTISGTSWGPSGERVNASPGDVVMVSYEAANLSVNSYVSTEGRSAFTAKINSQSLNTQELFDAAVLEAISTRIQVRAEQIRVIARKTGNGASNGNGTPTQFGHDGQPIAVSAPQVSFGAPATAPVLSFGGEAQAPVAQTAATAAPLIPF